MIARSFDRCLKTSLMYVGCLAWLNIPLPLVGQTQSDVADWLAPDTAVVAHVSELKEFIDQVVKLDPLGNAGQQRIMELLSDSQFPVLNRSMLPEILERAEACYDLLRQAERASLVIHSATRKSIDWSLFIETKPDRQAELTAAIGELTAAIEDAIISTSDVDHSPDDPLIDFLRNDQKIEFDPNSFQVDQLDSWIVIFNNADTFEQIRQRWENSDRSRSLGQSRKYARAMNGLTSIKVDDYVAMQIYLSPAQVVDWFPYGNPREWEQLKIHEIVCVGGALFLSPSANQPDGSLPPILLDAFVHYTQPAVGYAQLFQFYRPVKLPPLAQQPIELLAFARDEASYFREKVDLLNQATETGATEQTWQRRFSNDGVDWFWKMMDRRKSTVQAVYRNSEARRDELLVIEEVDNLSSAERFAEKTLAQAEKYTREHRQTVEQPLYRRWIFETEQRVKRGLTWDHQTIDLPPAAVNPYHQCYALSDQWWINGKPSVVDQQLELLQLSENSEDQPTRVENMAEKIEKRMDAINERIGSESDPVMIQYLTKTYWTNELRAQEWDYARSDSQVLHTASSFEELTDDNEEIAQIREELIEKLGGDQILFFSTRVERDGDNFIPKSELHLPKPFNPTPDEFGFWLRPFSRQDQLKLAQWTTLQAMARSFGEHLILWNRQESTIRFTIGIYPTSADEQDDASQQKHFFEYWLN